MICLSQGGLRSLSASSCVLFSVIFSELKAFGYYNTNSVKIPWIENEVPLPHPLVALFSLQTHSITLK